MPLWTLWDKTKPPSQAVTKEHQDSPGTADGSIPNGLDENLAWLEEYHDPQPAYDTSAEKLRQNNGVVVIDQTDPRTGTRTWGWDKVTLSSAELREGERQTQLRREKVAVGVIVDKWRDDQQPVLANDVSRVLRFLGLRDGLDEQAYDE